ncbi:MAG: TolC family protein [Planctomycetales bacterium]|nr:TolC family protein [Planctomycetales bacterium]
MTPARYRLASTLPIFCLPPLLLLACCLVGAGCSPTYYRRQADAETYQLIAASADTACLPIEEIGVEPDPRSRFADPTCPDCPPMPPDDPASHAYMHEVDDKPGDPCWHDCGDANHVENFEWLMYLPRDDQDRVVLDTHGAVHMGLLHSRDYQQQLEELYLSALDVTFERFRFDTQLFGGFSTFLTADGPLRSGGESSSQLDVSTFPSANRLRAERIFATGGELMVGLANSLVWEFSGTDTLATTTLLDFSFVQPLLRGAGRDVVMESLTQSQRNLLANIRQFERFKRGYYAEIAVGRNAGQGPSRSGTGGSEFGVTTSNSAGGLLGLLQNQQEIRNQVANVRALRESVDQLQAAHEAGRIDRFQVDLARQSLYNAQSRLLSIEAGYESTLDGFKFQLGLPPGLDVVIDDPLLRRFDLIDPQLSELQDAARNLISRARSETPLSDTELVQLAADIEGLNNSAQEHVKLVVGDFNQLLDALPERQAVLKRLSQRDEVVQELVDREPLDEGALEERTRLLREDLARLISRFDTLDEQLGEILSAEEQPLDSVLSNRIAEIASRLANQLLELSLIQAQTRLDSIVLTQVTMEPDQAFRIAIANRRDLKNARAALVDTWRQIRIRANDLETDLDIVFSGDLGNRGDNPFRLDTRTGRLRAGLEIDAPISRLAERNDYREALINYQRARRRYMASVDRIEQSLRLNLRNLRLNELNFELRRAAVRVAISQVLLTNLRLSRPPKPGETSEFGNTTARDLVQALSDLLSVQNDFIGIWVNYEVQRVNLDLDLGTMQLDQRGIWLDPGNAIGSGAAEEPACSTRPLERSFIEIGGPER